jgi:hypothetical protein
MVAVSVASSNVFPSAARREPGAKNNSPTLENRRVPALVELFRLGQVVVLSAALPLAVVAARGFRGTPFGRVVLPLVPITAAYLAIAATKLVMPDAATTASRLLGTVAVVLMAWVAAQAILLLSGRRSL